MTWSSWSSVNVPRVRFTYQRSTTEATDGRAATIGIIELILRRAAPTDTRSVSPP